MASTIVTTKAKKKMVEARAGIATLPKITGMAFGTGGVNSSGTIIDHTAGQNALYNEVYRQAVDGYTVISDTVIRYACTIAAGSIADGTNISEIGLYDSAGDFVALKSFHAKGIDSDMDMIFECDDTF